MTALARSIGTQDTVLYLSSSLDVGSLPAPYLVDAECILVTGGDMQSQVFVSRGQFGTAPETHDVGATLVSGWGSTNGPITLAQVLAQGNDTGGIGIVSDATGSDTADASTTATSVDGGASVVGTATTSGTGASNAARVANTNIVNGGSADASAYAQEASGHASATHAAQIGSGIANAESSAFSDEANAAVSANQSAQAVGTDGSASITTTASVTDGSGTADASTTATSVDGNATATTTATASGTGGADATNSATAAGGSASIGPIANSTRAEIQVNGLPLITTGSGAPGATFVSLLYVDTTGAPDAYCWDFVSGAYIQISG